ncbi:MAG: hypothetical protein KAR47_19405 [Planctomycetes bacterium]|nr:hypothetical protein [Planctomycetota bacterium]
MPKGILGYGEDTQVKRLAIGLRHNRDGTFGFEQSFIDRLGTIWRPYTVCEADMIRSIVARIDRAGKMKRRNADRSAGRQPRKPVFKSLVTAGNNLKELPDYG